MEFLKLNENINKKLYNTSGVTLIALVITIIVLLILASITLNLALDENGIIRKALGVSAKYKEAEQNELAKLGDLENNLSDIVNNKPQLAKDITLNKEETVIENRSTEKLIATINPVNVTSQILEWTSSQDEVATVAQDGTVSALSKGTTIITVKTTDGSNLSAQCTVTVPQSLYDLKLGDYVNYDSGANGIILCRVLYPLDSEYGLQIVSDKNVCNVQIGNNTSIQTGITEYNNAIQKLNDESEKYINSTYATDARSVGSIPIIDENGIFIEKNKAKDNDGKYINSGDTFLVPEEWNVNAFHSNSRDTGWLRQDENYITDYNQMKDGNIIITNERYYLASRRIGSADSPPGLLAEVRVITETSSIWGAYLCYVNQENGFGNSYPTWVDIGLRPCFALKSDKLKIESGDGLSSSSAYKLIIK